MTAGEEVDQGWLVRREDAESPPGGILDKVDLDTLVGAMRWRCECGRNGFTMKAENQTRRFEKCPDCGGSMSVWPSDETELEPAAANGATFSPDRVYRYTLSRTWAEGPVVLWVLLNPSTADEIEDDMTLTKAIGFSNQWGYGGLVFCNLFAFRATDPKDMKAAPQPIGPMNDRVLVLQAGQAETIVCAWGAGGSHLDRGERVLHRVLKRFNLWCLGLTKDGHPRHPVRLGYATKLDRFGAK